MIYLYVAMRKRTTLLNAERVKAWRAEKDLTQWEAAQYCRVAVATYQFAEYGQPMKRSQATKIATKIGIPLDQLEESNA